MMTEFRDLLKVTQLDGPNSYFFILFFLSHTLLLPTIVQRVKYRNNSFESYVQTPLGTKSTEWAQDASANERALLLMFKRA